MPKTVYRDEYQRLIALLRARREAAGLQQGDVAVALSRGQPFVSDLELGKLRLDVMQFMDYCTVLGIRPSRLLQQFEEGEERLRAPQPSTRDTKRRRV